MKREDLNQAITLLENASAARVEVKAAIARARAAAQAAATDIYAPAAAGFHLDVALAHLDVIRQSTGLAARLLKEAVTYDLPGEVGRESLLKVLAQTGHRKVSDMADEVLRLREENAALKARTCPDGTQTDRFRSGGFVGAGEPEFSFKLDMDEFEHSNLLALLNAITGNREPISLETATREYQEALREAAETYATRVTALLKKPGAPANVDVTATGGFVKRYEDGRIVEMVAEPASVSTTVTHE